MPPQIFVEDMSSPMNSVSAIESASINSWKSTTTLRVDEKLEGRQTVVPHKESSLKRWWSNTAQQASPGSPNWKPLSMTTPILSAIILASLLMVAAIELLAQKSQRQGGLALSPSLKEIPQYAMITSQYIPQVLAVCYSLVWSWIDLDVKRMQPWFEMSKPEGALAGDSLLLDYPYTFVAFVPFKAAQRKHWMVFLSGFTMVLVFWAITPLQSAQLGTDSVRQSLSRDIYERSSLIPLSKQKDLLGPGIMNLAYAIAWLDQPFPAFTTANAAYLPFYVNETTRLTATTKTNWTADTFRLTTELDCWPAEVSNAEFAPPTTLNFLNGQGCNASMGIPQGQMSMFYTGYYDSPHSSFWLHDPKFCPENDKSKHQFLATWVDAKEAKDDQEKIEYNATAIYCQPKYLKQEVRLTVDANTLTPDESSMETLSEPQPLQDSEFNTTAFEFLLSHGIDQQLKMRDYPESFVVEQHQKIVKHNISIPTSNMVPFAFAYSNRNINEFSDPDVLAEAFNTAHQYLFSFTVSQLLINSTDFNARTANSTSLMSGIVVSRSISAALEALILLIVVFTGLMIWVCRSSPTNLDKNPSSIQRLAEICQNDPRILDMFSSASHSDDKTLGSNMVHNRYCLVWDEAEQRPFIHVNGTEQNNNKTASIHRQHGYYEPIKPLALRKESGLAFVVIILGVIGGLIYLKWAEVEYNGLKKPSRNQEVQQILENFIPTMISTMIEPFWVLVNRLLCVLQPFKDLWKGKAPSDHTISTTYTSIPPQFVVWRALKSRHFILPVVCSAVFLANVLTISLPAIFMEAETTGRYTQTFSPMVSANFDNSSVFGLYSHVVRNMVKTTSYEEHKYSALANMTMGTPLLPWVSDEYFFQPWNVTDIKQSPETSTDSYNISTRGYGIDINCKSVPSSELPPPTKTESAQQTRTPTPDDCGDPLSIAKTELRTSFVSRSQAEGRSSIEYGSTTAGGYAWECDRTLILGWGRTSERTNNTIPSDATVEASFAICEPILQTAMFEISVDGEGHILSHRNTSRVEDYDEPDVQIERLIADANGWVINGGGWHNSTLSEDWLNYLVALQTGSRKHIDPNEPAPDPDDMIIQIEFIYRKLFSLLLGLQYEYLFEASSPEDIMEGTVVVEETRLFLDQPAFITSMIMLVINIVVATVLYIGGITFVLPRMPTTIGSLVAYIAPSRMMEEMSFRFLRPQERTFSFGRFIGRDGRAHVGIEMDPHVVRIDPSSIGKQKRRLPPGMSEETERGPRRAETWV